MSRMPGALPMDISDLFYLRKLDEARPGGGQPATDAENDTPLIETALRIASRLPEPQLQPQAASDWLPRRASVGSTEVR
jgi:hypothetical protein